MKVLLINDYDFMIGGAEVVFFNTHNLLVSHGHEVKTFGAKSKGKLPPILKGWFSISYLLKSYTLIKNFRPDIIHVHGCIREISPSVLLNAKFFNIPLVYTVHDFDLLGPEITLIHKSIPYIRAVKLQFQNFLIESCVNAFISPSRSLQSLLTKKFKNIPVFYIPNFMNLPPKKSTNQNKVLPEYFLYVGRLSKEKGIDILVKAFGLLIKDHSKIMLRIIGEGNEKVFLENTIKKSKLDNNIALLGNLSGDNLEKQYQDCIAVIIPSSYMENSPLVGYEAMYNAKPIIATNIGGLPDLVIHGENGFLFSMNNVNELFHYMNKILQNKNLINTLGKRSYELYKSNFDQKHYYTRLIDTYHSLLNNKSI